MPINLPTRTSFERDGKIRTDAKRYEIFRLLETGTMLALFADRAWEIFPNKWSNHGCKKPNAHADYEHLHNRAKP